MDEAFRSKLWKQAELAEVTPRSYADQMDFLGLESAKVTDAYISVLGPGADFALEKGLVRDGAKLVVAQSYSYHRHTSAETVSKENPSIKLIEGYFQEIPPATDIYDLVLSSQGFPHYAYEGTVTDEKSPVLHKENWEALIDTIKPGGEARLWPTYDFDVVGLKQLAQERPTAFSYTLDPKTSLLVITKIHSFTETAT